MVTALDLRTGVARLTTAASRDLDKVWRQVDTPDAARDAMRDVLPGLARGYGSASSTLATQWYNQRRAEVAPRGKYIARPARLANLGTDELAGWGVTPLYQADPNWASARTFIAGGLQRRIANLARDTVTRSSIADPAARGWERVGDGNECEFCSMLISRSGVYSEATASFEAHDHCGCQASPVWG